MDLEKLLLIAVFLIVFLPFSYCQGIPEQENGKWGLIDVNTDQTIAEFKYDEIIESYSGYFPANQSGKWGVLKSNGNVLIPFDYESIRDDMSGFFIVQKNGKEGVIDSLNKTVVGIKYDDIDNFSKDSTVLVKRDDEWFYLKNNEVTTDKDLIFINPDEKPLFTRCKKCSKEEAERQSERDLLQFFFKKLRYPKEAKKQNISGIIVVSFVINEQGSVENPKILREIGGNCGQAGIDVINQLPLWHKAAIKDGNLVKSQFVMPLKFTLQ